MRHSLTDVGRDETILAEQSRAEQSRAEQSFSWVRSFFGWNNDGWMDG